MHLRRPDAGLTSVKAAFKLTQFWLISINELVNQGVNRAQKSNRLVNYGGSGKGVSINFNGTGHPCPSDGWFYITTLNTVTPFSNDSPGPFRLTFPLTPLLRCNLTITSQKCLPQSPARCTFSLTNKDRSNPADVHQEKRTYRQKNRTASL